MKAYFEAGKPKVDIEVVGLYDSVKVAAEIDTGFDGDLMMPLSDATRIGLVLTRIDPMGLADGSKVNVYGFAGNVILEEKEVPIDILVTGSMSLVGTGLLRRYELRVNFHHQKIDITPI
jgi:clan AA aspartic protease